MAAPAGGGVVAEDGTDGGGTVETARAGKASSTADGATSLASVPVGCAVGRSGDAFDRPFQAMAATRPVTSSIAPASHDRQTVRRPSDSTEAGERSAGKGRLPVRWRQAGVSSFDSIDGPLARKVRSLRAQPLQNIALSRFAVWQTSQINAIAVPAGRHGDC